MILWCGFHICNFVDCIYRFVDNKLYRFVAFGCLMPSFCHTGHVREVLVENFRMIS
jgi:hypothetical protein